MAQRKVSVKTPPEQVVQLPEQTVLSQRLHSEAVTMPSLCTQQDLGVKHHQEHGEKVRRLLPLP